LIAAEAGEQEQRDYLARLYREESPAALQLAVDRPRFWEYLLTIELIRDKLRRTRQHLSELEEGIVYIPTKIVELTRLPTWLRERTGDILSLIDVLQNIVLKKIPSSWGPEGQPGDPEKILRTCNLLWDACKGLLEWEREVARTEFPDEFDDLRLQMRGWTHGFFQEMEKIPSQMSAPLQDAAPGLHTITIHFLAPEGLDAFAKEFNRRFILAHR
jgi:hypothetical protein